VTPQRYVAVATHAGASFQLVPQKDKADHYLPNSSTDYSGIKDVLDVEILERPMSFDGYVISY